MKTNQFVNQSKVDGQSQSKIKKKIWKFVRKLKLTKNKFASIDEFHGRLTIFLGSSIIRRSRLDGHARTAPNPIASFPHRGFFLVSFGSAMSGVGWLEGSICERMGIATKSSPLFAIGCWPHRFAAAARRSRQGKVEERIGQQCVVDVSTGSRPVRGFSRRQV